VCALPCNPHLPSGILLYPKSFREGRGDMARRHLCSPLACLALAGASFLVPAPHRHGDTGATTDALVRRLGQHGHRAHLAVTGGCYVTVQPPEVVTTTFGPLVGSDAVIHCLNPETLSIIVSIYRGLDTRVGTAEGTSTGPALTLSVSAYSFCTHITETHDFRTSVIWDVNDADEGGATSNEVALHCT
jgi:hypothetical protein